VQFIYLDESGTGDEPVAVMVGIIADSHRMRVTKEHWNSLLSILSKIIKKDIHEIHTRDFYSGNSPWRDLTGNQRSKIITTIFNWLKTRRHSIVFSAVDKNNFYNNFRNEHQYGDVKTVWRFMALHIALALQKAFQGTTKNKRERKHKSKGSCVLIFDNENREEHQFTELLLNAPDWTDSYYDKKIQQEKFSQIIDVPHFVDSKQVGLIQLADFICFFLRKHIELSLGYVEPNYDEEIDKVNKWKDIILNQTIAKRNIYMSRGRCECSELFYKYAPENLK